MVRSRSPAWSTQQLSQHSFQATTMKSNCYSRVSNSISHRWSEFVNNITIGVLLGFDSHQATLLVCRPISTNDTTLVQLETQVESLLYQRKRLTPSGRIPVVHLQLVVVATLLGNGMEGSLIVLLRRSRS